MTTEATILLGSLNTFREILSGMQGAQNSLVKEMVMSQMQTILSYFEDHQDTMPIGYSATLGYYFQSDLCSK